MPCCVAVPCARAGQEHRGLREPTRASRAERAEKRAPLARSLARPLGLEPAVPQAGERSQEQKVNTMDDHFFNLKKFQNRVSSSPGRLPVLIAKDDLELQILPPLPPKHWDDRHAPPPGLCNTDDCTQGFTHVRQALDGLFMTASVKTCVFHPTFLSPWVINDSRNACLVEHLLHAAACKEHEGRAFLKSGPVPAPGRQKTAAMKGMTLLTTATQQSKEHCFGFASSGWHSSPRQSSCLGFLSAGITRTYHHARLRANLFLQ